VPRSHRSGDPLPGDGRPRRDGRRGTGGSKRQNERRIARVKEDPEVRPGELFIASRPEGQADDRSP
jgi:hypothetical protein